MSHIPDGSSSHHHDDSLTTERTVVTGESTGETSYSETESGEETSTTVPSSQWSEKRREIYDTMNPEEQELFDELQQEIEELRRLLGRGMGQEAVQKVDC